MQKSEDRVLFYEGKHYMYSNFSSFAFYMNGALMMTGEHGYQAYKFIHRPDIFAQVVAALSAHDAKKIARAYQADIRPDWYEVNLDVMDDVVQKKLDQHLYIQSSLIQTREAEMIEDSPKDSFWGRGSDWNGSNHLGKIWMRKRRNLVIGKMEELVRTAGPDRSCINVGPRTLTWDDLLQEVRNETDLGKRYYSAFIECL